MLRIISIFTIFAVVLCDVKLIELGSGVKNGKSAHLTEGLRMNFTYANETQRAVVSKIKVTVDETTPFTIISSKHEEIPFTAQGCMPTYVVTSNETTGEVGLDDIKEFADKLCEMKYTVVIFNNKVKKFSKLVREAFDGKKVIVATFEDNSLDKEVVDELKNTSVVFVENLVRKPEFDAGKQYWSYVLVYDLGKKKLDFLLANLILVEQSSDFELCNADHRLAVLSHSFSGQLPMFPGMPIVPFVDDENRINIYDHYGSHFDSPNHFYEHGTTADKLDLSFSFVPCMKVEDKASKPYFLFSKSALEAWEKEAGMEIPKKGLVLFDSGNYKNWEDTDKYVNFTESTMLGHPGVEENAVRWLLNDRNISAIGIDTLTPDNGLRHDFPDHVLLAKGNRLLLENVANLGEFPNSKGKVDGKGGDRHPVGQCLYVYLRMEGCSGAPMAVFAHLEPARETSSKPTLRETSGATVNYLATVVYAFCLVLAAVF